MLRMAYLSLCLLFVCGCFLCHAQAQTEYEITSFSESLSPQVNVSGGVLVSYQIVGSSLNPNNQSLYIARENGIESLHVVVKSIDGNYEAKFEVALRDSDKKWIKVSFPTKYQHKLKTYSADEVSVIAYTEVPSKRRKKLWRVLPTSWGVPNESQQYFYVNSSGDFAKYVYKNAHGTKITEYCEPIKASIQTAFNYKCLIKNTSELKSSSVTFITEVGGKKDRYQIW